MTDHPDHPEGTTTKARPDAGDPNMGWLVLTVLSIIGFVALTLVVKAGMLTAFDHTLLASVHQQIPHTSFWDLISASANIPLIVIGLGFVGWLFVTGRHREAILALILMGVITGGSELTKLLVAERRPSGNGDGIPGVPGAYPSGHELEVLSILGMVTIRFWRSSFARWARLALAALVTIEVILVGVARLVLDEHWPADVLAGFLGGFVVLGLYAWFTRPGGWADRPPLHEPSRPSAPPREGSVERKAA